MATYVDEKGRSVKARSYKEAAENLYGQEHYYIPGFGNRLRTTYVDRSIGYATVRKYRVGAKQGSYWGIQAARPVRHMLRRKP